MTTKEHHHAELLRAIAEGKTIKLRSTKLSAESALSLILQGHTGDLAIAPDAIVVNGIEVPAPYRGPMQNGQVYGVANPTREGHVSCHIWCDDDVDRMWLERGRIHLNAAAAAAHGRAMAAASMEGGAE